MSQSIVLFTPKEFNRDSVFLVLKNYWPVSKEDLVDGNIELHININDAPSSLNRKYFAISELTPTEEIANEYEDYEEIDSKTKISIHDCLFFHARFNDILLARDVLEKILMRQSERLEYFWLDNGYGLIMPGQQVMYLLAQDKNWGTVSFDI